MATPGLFPILPAHHILATFFIQMVPLDTFCMQLVTFGSILVDHFYAWSKEGCHGEDWGPTKKILILLGINM